MKFSLSLSLATLLLAPTLCYAQGDKSGGGGDLVICETSTPRKGFINKIFGGKKKRLEYFLFDVYEAREDSKGIAEALSKPELIRDLNLGGPELTIYEKINLIRDEFAKIDPIRAQKYAAEATRIALDLEANEFRRPGTSGLAILYPRELPDIKDANDYFKHSGCIKAQLVRQEPARKNGPEFLFVRKWWKRLDTDNRVATIYHEVIYKEFRQYYMKLVKDGLLREEDVNSDSIRYLNSLLFSLQIGRYGLRNYLEFLNDRGPGEYYLDSDIGPVRLVRLSETQNVWSGRLSSEGYVAEADARQSGISPMSLTQHQPLPLRNVTRYEFNSERKLSGFIGEFSVAYDDTGRIVDWYANCRFATSRCFTGTKITLGPNGLYRLWSSVGFSMAPRSILFDRNGLVYIKQRSE